MSVVQLSTVPVKEIFPGIRARVVHTERTSQSFVEIQAGASFPQHQHPHEQTVNMLEGELEIVVGSETHRLTPGQVLVIPPDVPHSGHAVTNCRVLDVFAPTRDDYR
jgi:quercetin dioxygenase-like cupin family protein